MANSINVDKMNRKQLRTMYREIIGIPADRTVLDRSRDMRIILKLRFAAQAEVAAARAAKAAQPEVVAPTRVRMSLADLIIWVTARVGTTVQIPEEGIPGLPASAQKHPAYWTSRNNNGTRAATAVGVKVSISKAKQTIEVSEVSA